MGVKSLQNFGHKCSYLHEIHDYQQLTGSLHHPFHSQAGELDEELGGSAVVAAAASVVEVGSLGLENLAKYYWYH